MLFLKGMSQPKPERHTPVRLAEFHPTVLGRSHVLGRNPGDIQKLMIHTHKSAHVPVPRIIYSEALEGINHYVTTHVLYPNISFLSGEYSFAFRVHQAIIPRKEVSPGAGILPYRSLSTDL